MLNQSLRHCTIALLASLGLAGLSVATWDQVVTAQRVERIQLETRAMAGLVESVSSKGVVMSGAALIGVFDVRAKRVLSNPNEAMDLESLADFATVIELLHAKAASILDDKGVARVALDAQGTFGGVGAEIAQKSYIRSALAGKPAVLLELESAQAERLLHFAAPVFEERTTNSKVVGVYHLEMDGTDIDRVLANYLPRTALLLSPDGVAFASNQSVPALLNILGLTAQYKALWQIPWPMQGKPVNGALGRMEVPHYRAASAKINWPSEQGAWQVLLLEPEREAADNWARMALGLMVFGLLFGGYYMLARHNAAQSKWRHVLQGKQAEQQASLLAYADQVDFQERLMDAIPTPLFVKDTQGRTAGMNRAYEEAYGLRREDCIGKTLLQVPMGTLDEAQRRSFFEEQLRIIESGERVHKAREMRWIDGAIHHELYWGQGIRKADGKPAGMVGVILDVSDTVHANIALQAAKVAAEEAGAAKSAFLANMSHEIRTPMNAIIGLSGLALKNEMPPRIQDYLTKIKQSGEHLLGIINDILDYSKIESGKMEVESVPFEIDAIMENVITLISEKVEDKGLELLCRIHSDIPKTLLGDPLRIGQILINLTNNAVKFTQHGEIKLTISIQERLEKQVLLLFQISDTGIGLSQEQIGKLFKSFEQADRSTTRKYGGTGLGLAISKSLVQAMGGEIGVESTVGAGAQFWFTAQLGIGSSERFIPTPAVDLHGRLVLVVDDNEAAALMLVDTLSELGFAVDHVGSGQAALERLKAADALNKPYDFVLMDWQMPEMDGLETVKAIAAQHIRNTPFVLMVTAHRRAELVKAAEALGIDHVLAKPVSGSLLVNTMMHILGHDQGDAKLLQVNRQDDRYEARLAPIRGARILLVEDNEINQQVAVELLASVGFEVEVAGDGQIAVNQIQARFADKRPYDIVLMDMQMPVMDGCTAARLVRETHSAQDFPIVAMTANAMKDDRDRCLSAGMNAVVTKPSHPESLWKALLTWIQVREGMGVALPTAAAPIDIQADALTERLRSIPGLDVDLGLMRTTDNPAFYASMLRKFVPSQEDAVVQMQQALEAQDLASAERIAHTLKGVSASLGATDLPEQAELLEMLLRTGVQGEELKHAIAQTLQALERLIAGLKATPGLLLTQSAADASTLSAAQRSSAEQLLTSIQTLLAEDDAEAAALWESHAALLRAVVPQAAQVEAAIAGFDYEAALKILLAPRAVR